MRRLFITLLTLSCFFIIAACGNSNPISSGEGSASAPASESNAAANKFKGQTISLYLSNTNWGESIKKILPDFEAETGMKVKMESFAEAQLAQKLSIQFASGSNTPDVYMFRPDTDGPFFYENGWMEQLQDYVQADPDFDPDDFGDSLENLRKDGQLTGLPGIVNTEVLYYRKDLLQQAGLSVPATIDDLVKAAKTLNDPNQEIYGFVGRGSMQDSVISSSGFLYSEGGKFITDGKASINTPEAVKAFTTYGSLIRDYGPPGALSMNFSQTSALFAQGKAALMTDGSGIFVNFASAEKSPVWDKIGYAPFPAGSAGSKPYVVTGWGIAMNKNSQNKDAAWELMRWLTSKETVRKTQALGTAGARQSVWNDSEGGAAFPPDLIKAIQSGMENGVRGNAPSVTNVMPAKEAVGSIVVNVIQGKDVQAEADKQNEALQRLIDADKS